MPCAEYISRRSRALQYGGRQTGGATFMEAEGWLEANRAGDSLELLLGEELDALPERCYLVIELHYLTQYQSEGCLCPSDLSECRKPYCI
jgi:hypothetical protein